MAVCFAKNTGNHILCDSNLYNPDKAVYLLYKIFLGIKILCCFPGNVLDICFEYCICLNLDNHSWTQKPVVITEMLYATHIHNYTITKIGAW